MKFNDNKNLSKKQYEIGFRLYESIWTEFSKTLENSMSSKWLGEFLFNFKRTNYKELSNFTILRYQTSCVGPFSISKKKKN